PPWGGEARRKAGGRGHRSRFVRNTPSPTLPRLRGREHTEIAALSATKFVVCLPRLRGGAFDRGRGLAEQDGAFLRRADAAHIRVHRFCLLVGPLDRGAPTDRFEPALEVREIGDVLALPLIRHDPGID